MEVRLKREIARMTVEEQQQQMQEDKKRRQADLELLGEVNALVPSLVQGYDYTRVIDMLSGTRLETADVRNALDGRLYLYTQARDFRPPAYDGSQPRAGAARSPAGKAAR
jgi:hypothetical protein